MNTACFRTVNVVVLAGISFRLGARCTTARSLRRNPQRRTPPGFSIVHMIVQMAGMFHAATPAAADDSTSGTYFQLQLGIKLFPVCVS